MSIASEEEYRPILEYEGYYEVSNYGNVKSVDRYVNHPQKGYSFKKGKTLSKSYSKKTNILRTCIDNCLNGRSKTAGGYIWEYVVGGVNNVN